MTEAIITVVLLWLCVGVFVTYIFVYVCGGLNRAGAIASILCWPLVVAWLLICFCVILPLLWVLGGGPFAKGE